MRRYRWNRRRFMHNMMVLLILVALSIMMTATMMWGLEQEDRVQATRTQNHIQMIENMKE